MHPKSTSESLTRVAHNGFGAKTILISSFHSLISRNILGTPVLSRLVEGGVKVVIACPEHKQAFFEREFGGAHVVIAPVPLALTRRDTLLRSLALSAVRTRTLAIKRQTELAGRGRLLSLALANRGGRAFVRLATRLLSSRAPFTALLATHAPALVFSTDMQNEHDVRLMLAAQGAHTPVVGMARSWDNFSAKGLVRYVPERVLVQNELLKREAGQIQGIGADQVEAVGIPHYDFYVTGERSTRDAFFKRVGGDSQKKLLLYVPTGDRYLSSNTVDADILAMLDEHLPSDFQILVRLPPGDRVRALEGYLNTSRIIIDRPSTAFASVKETELSHENEVHLADSLHFADLVVSGPSTMCIDACVFDTPVILVGFDGREEREYAQSIRRFYDYDHFAPVLAAGGVRYAKSETELAEALERYVRDPSLEAEGRARIVALECFKADGHSSERLAKVLLGALQSA